MVLEVQGQGSEIGDGFLASGVPRWCGSSEGGLSLCFLTKPPRIQSWELHPGDLV